MIVGLSTLVIGGRSWISSLIFIGLMIVFWIGGIYLTRGFEWLRNTYDENERRYRESLEPSPPAPESPVDEPSPGAPLSIRVAAPPVSAYEVPRQRLGAPVEPIPELSASPWSKRRPSRTRKN